MNIYKNRIISNNYSLEKIKPELIIIHYTACSWKRAKYLFEKGNVAAHFLIDVDGSIDEVIPTLNSYPKKGKHAGNGKYTLNNKKWEKEFNFNKISIGIELVNFNGNIIEYSEKQYYSLAKLCKLLIEQFPILNNPKRIIGHEHIAFYRGKADPGVKFDWNYFFSLISLKKPDTLKPALPKEIQNKIIKKMYNIKKKEIDLVFETLSKYTENLTKKYFENENKK